MDKSKIQFPGHFIVRNDKGPELQCLLRVKEYVLKKSYPLEAKNASKK